MTLSPQKRDQLSSFLGSLPTAAALKLFAAIEADRAKGGKDLPHDALLSDLRKRLLEKGAVLPQRKPDAKRVFFTPFEDFFIGKRRGKKRKGQIARTSLEPIWRLMMTDDELTEAAFAAAALDDALAGGEGDAAALERTLFVAAEAGLARLCDRAREDKTMHEALAGELGGEAAFLDMLELRQLLSGVDALKKLQAAITSPSPPLTEEQYYELRTLFLSVHDRSRPMAASLLLALKGRLEKPWRALGVYYHLARGADDQLRAAREAVMALPESIFEDIEDIARELEKDCAGPLHAEMASLRIHFFADYVDGLLSQATRIGDNVYVNRIEACRDVVAESLDRFAELALSALREAMPIRHSGGSSRLMSLRPDISRPLSPETVNEAAASAKFLTEAAALAVRLSADPAFATSTTEEAAEKIHAYARDLIAEIRAAEGDERKAARRMLDEVLKIAGPLLESDDIGLIRDRAAAAAVTV